MITQPTLSPDQWNMVLQILEVECENLHPEIRHTDSPRVHDQLVERLRMLEDIVARIRQATLATA